MTLIISTGRLEPTSLDGRTVIVTGGANGIGVEAARSLLWLGARVALADVDAPSLGAVAETLRADWGADRVLTLPTDVSDEAAVARFVAMTTAAFGRVDAVLNNATAAPTGDGVWETALADWDRSYAVNLRAPALLARACVPAMVERGSGTFVCVSSVGGPYQAAYESMKAAQVVLATALGAELEGTGVIAFTIGPGLVPTPTAVSAVGRLLPRLGLSGAEFLELTGSTLIGIEAAGAGFAAAIAMAERYGGQEISSSQALVDAGIALPDEPVSFPLPGGEAPPPGLGGDGTGHAEPASIPADVLATRCRRVRATLAEQADGWRHRSFFERQWMLRDFKNRTGMPLDGWLELLDRLESDIAVGGLAPLRGQRERLRKLEDFYVHLGDLARGYVKDPAERDAQLAVVGAWAREVRELMDPLERA